MVLKLKDWTRMTQENLSENSHTSMKLTRSFKGSQPKLGQKIVVETVTLKNTTYSDGKLQIRRTLLW